MLLYTEHTQKHCQRKFGYLPLDTESSKQENNNKTMPIVCSTRPVLESGTSSWIQLQFSMVDFELQPLILVTTSTPSHGKLWKQYVCSLMVVPFGSLVGSAGWEKRSKDNLELTIYMNLKHSSAVYNLLDEQLKLFAPI